MSHRSFLHPLALSLVSLLAAASTAPGLQAEPDRPDPPRSRVRIYDADPLTCRPAVIEAAFHSHMAPWADQPETVQQRLRILQGELTRSTLERCRQKGLMSVEQVQEVETRLGLSPAKPSTPQSSGSPARP